jgi:hypothetical protein
MKLPRTPAALVFDRMVPGGNPVIIQGQFRPAVTVELAGIRLDRRITSENGQKRVIGRSNIRAMHRWIIGTKPTLLLYHGWLVVAAAFLVALYGFGLGFYGPGIYLVALNTLHGWPTSEFSSAITAYYVLGATLLFFWIGHLFDRHGARKIVVAGTVAMACGVVLLALSLGPGRSMRRSP